MSESGLSEAVSYILVWIAHPGACKRCLLLHGTIWIMQRLDGFLVHPEFGTVYDLANGISWAHPYCHCSIDVAEIQVDLGKVELGES